MKFGARLVALGCAALTVFGQAQVLLQINNSDPSAVTITATTANAAAEASVDRLVGVSLMGFFTSDTAFTQPAASTGTLSTDLSAPGGAFDSGSSTSPDQGGLYFGRNFVIYGGSSLGTLLFFTTTQQAFIGTTTMNLSSSGNPNWNITSENLPANETVGDIRVGSDVGFETPGTVIGQWQIVNEITPVPEPASVGLTAGLALGGFALLRKRLKKA